MTKNTTLKGGTTNVAVENNIKVAAGLKTRRARLNLAPTEKLI
jgi:hypothetical protein